MKLEQGATVAISVQSGARVLFGKWSATEVKLDGEELRIIKQIDLPGVIDAAESSLAPAA